MKVFYTPVINGEFDWKAQRRLPDIEDNKAYAIVEEFDGEAGTEELDRDGYTKILDRGTDTQVKGMWTYQQDDL